eukprot:Nk52_evm8s371 gene=Nk52_evmTU8s371
MGKKLALFRVGNGFYVICCLFILLNTLNSFSEGATTCNPGTFLSNANCEQCPSGHYCTGGTAGKTPCPAGHFNSNLGSQTLSACQACINGQYSGAGSTSCTQCPAGSKCVSPSSSPTPCSGAGEYSLIGASACLQCPKGFMCPQPFNAPIACAKGTYASTLGSTGCVTCESGRECPTREASVQCGAGKYSIGNAETCSTCNPGTYSSAGASECTPCPGGHSCANPANAPTPCTAGSVAAKGSASCSACSAGSAPNVAKSACTTCPAGTQCSDPSITPVACSPGTWSASGASTCLSCPAGSSCKNPANAPVACNVGEYSLGGTASCLTCPGGSSCASKNQAPVPCGTGQYSTSGDHVCNDCPAGSSCSDPKKSPTLCPQGTYSQAKATTCSNCPAGSKCPDPSQSPIACLAGQYSLTSSTTCIACPVGFSCTSTNQAPSPCASGSYSAGNVASCTKCPAGSSCPDPTKSPIACAAGSFSAAEATKCTPCPAGWACPSISDPTQNVQCAPGSYSTGSQQACTKCTAGFMCPSKTLKIEVACEPGSWALAGSASCTSCVSGSQCPKTDGTGISACAAGDYSTGGQTACTKCPPGFECPSTTTATTNACPLGTYSTGSQVACTPCPAGKACLSTVSATQISCVAGFYSVGSQAACTACPKGFYCTDPTSNTKTACSAGSYSIGGKSSCTPCPAGSFCASASTGPVPCDPGFFSVAGASSCQACKAGSQCSDRKTEVLCPKGHWSPSGSDVCFKCDPGYDCVAGSTTANPAANICKKGTWCDDTGVHQCPVGTYGTVEGKATQSEACQPCPAGSYCEGTGTTTPGNPAESSGTCPAGHYCPAGTGNRNSFPCPPGTYNTLTGKSVLATACVQCPAGKYCVEGSTTDGTTCAAGFYCPAETGHMRQFPCPGGTYGDNTGFTSSGQCKTCTVGHYCPDGHATYSSSAPVPCPPGSYNPNVGSASSANCLACTARQACPSAGQSSVTDSCAEGYYCPEGTAAKKSHPCYPGTYSQATNLQSATECLQCPQSFACGWATGVSVNPKVACMAGHYCPAGTGFADQFPCPPGTFTGATDLFQSTDCTDCTAGNYCLGGGSTVTGTCPVGHYCPTKTTFPDQFPCTAGTYVSSTGSTQSSDCVTCTQGHFCELGTGTPVKCPSGTYMPNTGAKKQSDCLPCTAGHKCGEATVTPVQCLAQEFSDVGASTCTSCQAGHFCSTPGTTQATMLASNRCAAGGVCATGSLNQAASVTCNAGHYCPEATTGEIKCPVGTYNTNTGSISVAACLPCPAGKYCLEASINPTGDCAAGYFCPTGMTDPMLSITIGSSGDKQEPCPGGKYLGTTGGKVTGDCLTCPETFYCPPGTATPIKCQRGHYCPLGISLPTPCPPGTFSTSETLKASSECTKCTAGSFCDGYGLQTPRGLCDPGYYCTLGATTSTPPDGSTGGLCPAGGYCPAGTVESLPCPQGTFSTQAGAANHDFCISCTPGHYCASARGPAPTGKCDAGYYCTGGAKTAKQFATTKGHYSPQGSVGETKCQPGTYQPSPAQPSCLQCPAGFYCPTEAMSSATDCPLGSYCVAGSFEPKPCPTGTFGGSKNLKTAAECTDCPAGSFCQNTGLTAVSGQCNAGHICTGRAELAAPIASQSVTWGDRCPAGFACPQGATSPSPCPAGKFSDTIGLTTLNDCKPCTPGHYCPSTGMTSPQGKCDPGYFCTSASTTKTPTDGSMGNICQAGHECPQGASQPIPCVAGKHAAGTGNAACVTCPVGNYCAGTTALQPCPLGNYCTLGTTTLLPKCPAGTYATGGGLAAQSDCTQCDPGKYCDTEKASAVAGSCSAGYYCQSGVNTPTPGSGHTGIGGECPAGHFCPTGTSVPTPCPIGKYSPNVRNTQSSDCQLCDPGKYCDSTSLSAVKGNCAIGYYCLGGATKDKPSPDGPSGGICPIGHYCPAGATAKIPCVAGTYQDQTGQGTCKQCPAGYFCLQGASSFSSNVCPKGHYCPVGTKFDKEHPCPIKTHNNLVQQTAPSACIDCPGGKFCATAGLDLPTGDCGGGYFCTGRTTSASPAVDGGKCVASQYCPVGSTAPLSCSAGSFCKSEGLAAPEGDCTAGYFCIGGATVANPVDGTTGNICPKGHFCVAKSSSPTPCPIGTFSAKTGNPAQASCEQCTPGSYCETAGLDKPTGLCDAGYFCPLGQSVKSPAASICPKGHYCPAGSASAIRCASGKYQDKVGQSSCIECPTGFFCDNTKAAVVLFSSSDCPAGHFCPLGTKFATQFPCSSGTFSASKNLKQASECTKCSAKKFCAGTGNTAVSGDCSAGYFCQQGAATSSPRQDSSANICPVGHYCPLGTDVPIKCPIGTFNDKEGLTVDSQCQQCTPGSYCSVPGSSSVTGKCDPGYYCNSGSTEAKPSGKVYGDVCPAGSYCPTGTSTPSLCPTGTFSNTKGLSSSGQCTTCTPGKFCQFTGLTAVSGSCAAGYFCSAGAKTAQPSGDPTGGPCTIGHYCPVGTAAPIPCPDGKYMLSPQASACLPCPASKKCVNQQAPVNCPQGFYCPEGTGNAAVGCPTGATATSGQCNAGYYCSSGVDTPTPGSGHKGSGGICPVGKYCPQGSTTPINCPAGTYNTETTKGSCIQCPAKYFCSDGSSSYLDKPCSPGHFCPTGTKSGTDNPCPVGKYNPSSGGGSSSACLDCSAGKYCETQGLSAVTGDCLAGFFCIKGAKVSAPTDSTGGKCRAGFFCPLGSDKETPCTPGKYCETTGLGAPTADCDPGYFCTGSSTVKNPIDGTMGNICPTGYYCPTGSSVPIACPAGKYQPATGKTQSSDCLDCLPGRYCATTGLANPTGQCAQGYYCTSGKSTDKPAAGLCTKGHYCPAGSPAPVRCPSGEYQDQTGQSACKPCPEGYFCDATKAPVTLFNDAVCSKGHYCPAKTKFATEKPCPVGTFNDLTGKVKEADCKPCSAGKYCSKAGLVAIEGSCSAGYFCVSGATSPTPRIGLNANVCPKGHYCVSGTITPVKCPAGKYASQENLKAESECTACDPGKYCASSGLQAVTGDCAAGFFCGGGSMESNPTGKSYGDVCPAGKYCIAGTSTPVNCPSGTFSLSTGLKDVTECSACTAGKFCAGSGLTSVSGNCKAGFFCTSKATTDSPTDGTTGNKCPAGHYCPTGSSAPVPCLKGSYAANVNQATCTSCPAGFTCTNGVTPDMCPAGSYCPSGTGVNPTPCPAGTFSNTKGLQSKDECTSCSAGKYCGIPGSTTVTGDCSAGFYCTSGVDRPTPSGAHTGVGGVCGKGTMCPGGSSSPQECAAGTYSNSNGLSSCLQCPKGYFCPKATQDFSANPCPKGHFCPLGTGDGKANPCPSGTFGDIEKLTAESECKACTAGSFCETAGLQAPNGLCSPGYFCKAGSTSRSPTNTIQGGKCLKGTYCPSGAITPIDCSPGSFCATDGLSSPTGKCSSGYFCISKATSITPTDGITGNICPAGHYCPEGSGSALPCPASKYSSATGNIKSGDCLLCTPGSYCETTGLAKPTGQCTAGYYCPAGQNVPNPPAFVCQAGHMCPTGSASQVRCPSGTYQKDPAKATCTTCPAGYFCDATKSPVVLFSGSDCPQGYYCPAGTKIDKEFACPLGKFGGAKNLKSESECSICPGGKYCGSVGLTTHSGDCLAGYYCKSGAWLATPSDGVTGDRCPPGSFCTVGSAQPVACPSGTFSPSSGATSNAACIPCSAGKYCAAAGSQTSNELPCTGGYLCLQGADTPTPVDGVKGRKCKIGHYCPTGATTEIACAHGTFGPNDGLSACVPCTAGNYCPSSGMTSPTPCTSGNFCVQGSSTPDPCPAGTYSTTVGLSTSALCTSCPRGKYCDTPGAPTPKGDCAAGYYCHIQSSVQSPSGPGDFVSNGPCPKGHYCLQGTVSPTPCPIGTLVNQVGSKVEADCVPCTAGHYCETTGLALPTGKCDPGFFCPGLTANSEKTPAANVCPTGSSCPSGSSAPVKCADGFYQDQTQQGSCKSCPAGSLCQNGASATTPCPLKHFCAKEAKIAVVCPDGQYGHKEGLTAATDCPPCPAGKFCTNGEVSGDCAAGYFCTSGSNTATPDNLANAGKCPLGFFCPLGTGTPQACPPGKVINFIGATKETDCQPCPAGFTCPVGSNIAFICPKGYYCALSNPTIPCPIGTYSDKLGAKDNSTCLSCPEGYWCHKEATIDYTVLPCPVGSYCEKGVQAPSPCAAGWYRNATLGKSANDCTTCPGGFFCSTNSSDPLDVCPEGSYCPPGSAQAQLCPGGKYCPSQASAPVTCPATKYCPIGSGKPIDCPYGSYCPEGTDSPRICPLGYRFRNDTVDVSTVGGACEICPAGTYGNRPDRDFCAECEPGYVCLAGATNGTPVNETSERGYVCPAGSYCPAGSAFQKKCPVGTYGPNTGQVDTSGCIPCAAGTFNNLIGQIGCFPCGSSSSSGVGAFTCQCIGQNRAYQSSDGWCICQPNYEFVDAGATLTNVDGESDCTRKVFDRCAEGEARATNGKCYSSTAFVSYCNTACDNGVSSTDKSLGVCQCAGVDDVAQVCNAGCQSTQPTVELDPTDPTKIIVNDQATGQQTTLTISNSSIIGNTQCASKNGEKCNIAPLQMSGNGFVGVYKAPASYYIDVLTGTNTTARKFTIGSSRKLLQAATTTTGISDPIVCIQQASTVMWDVSGSRTSFPVYDKDNLLNTNALFDYGDFRRLETLMTTTSQSITAFSFPFNDPGVYVFYDFGSPEKRMILKVVSSQEICPSEGTFMAANTQNLVMLGVKKDDNILQSPDWILIFSMIGGGIALVIGIIVAIVYFRRTEWGKPLFKTPKYRKHAKKANFALYSSKGSSIRKEKVSHLNSLTGGGVGADDDNDDEFWDYERQIDLEGFSVQILYEKIKNQTEKVTSEIVEAKENIKELYSKLTSETDELKDLWKSKIGGGAGPIDPKTLQHFATVKSKIQDESKERTELGGQLLQLCVMRREAFENEEKQREIHETMFTNFLNESNLILNRTLHSVINVIEGEKNKVGSQENEAHEARLVCDKMDLEIDRTSRQIENEHIRRGVSYEEQHLHGFKICSNGNVISEEKMFSGGELKEIPNIVEYDSVLGLFIPGPKCEIFDDGSAKVCPSEYFIHPHTGRALPLQCYSALDPVNMKLVTNVNSRFNATGGQLIPFVPYRGSYWAETMSTLRFGEHMTDPVTGMQVPILGVTYNPSGELMPVGGTYKDPLTKLPVPIEIGNVAEIDNTLCPILGIDITSDGSVIPIGGKKETVLIGDAQAMSVSGNKVLVEHVGMNNGTLIVGGGYMSALDSVEAQQEKNILSCIQKCHASLSELLNEYSVIYECDPEDIKNTVLSDLKTVEKEVQFLKKRLIKSKEHRVQFNTKLLQCEQIAETNVKHGGVVGIAVHCLTKQRYPVILGGPMFDIKTGDECTVLGYVKDEKGKATVPLGGIAKDPDSNDEEGDIAPLAAPSECIINGVKPGADKVIKIESEIMARRGMRRRQKALEAEIKCELDNLTDRLGGVTEHTDEIENCEEEVNAVESNLTKLKELNEGFNASVEDFNGSVKSPQIVLKVLNHCIREEEKKCDDSWGSQNRILSFVKKYNRNVNDAIAFFKRRLKEMEGAHNPEGEIDIKNQHKEQMKGISSEIRAQGLLLKKAMMEKIFLSDYQRERSELFAEEAKRLLGLFNSSTPDVNFQLFELQQSISGQSSLSDLLEKIIEMINNGTFATSSTATTGLEDANEDAVLKRSPTGSQILADEVIENMPAERASVQRDIAKHVKRLEEKSNESKDIKSTLEELEGRKKDMIANATLDLENKLKNASSDDERQRILQAHMKDMARLSDNVSAEKERQMQTLKDRLARQKLLRQNKNSSQANEKSEEEIVKEVEKEIAKQEAEVYEAAAADAEGDAAQQVALSEVNDTILEQVEQHLQGMVERGELSPEEAARMIAEYKSKATQMEAKINEDKERLERELKKKLAKKKIERMNKLQRKHQEEKASAKNDAEKLQQLEGVLKEEARAIEVEIQAEGAQQEKALNDQLKAALVTEHHHGFYNIVSSVSAKAGMNNEEKDAILRQFEVDCKRLNESANTEVQRQKDLLRAKMEARKRARKMREEAAKEAVECKNAQSENSSSDKTIENKFDFESFEAALAKELGEEQEQKLKEQEKQIERMMREQEESLKKLEQEEEESRLAEQRRIDQEFERLEKIAVAKEKEEFEKKAIGASEDDYKSLLKEHEDNLRGLKNNLDSEKNKHNSVLANKIEERRQRRLREQEKRRELERAEQQRQHEKELQELQKKEIIEAEKAALLSSIRGNTSEKDANELIHAVLEKRHIAEIARLEQMFEEQKSALLEKEKFLYESKRAKERDAILDAHSKEELDLIARNPGISDENLQKLRGDLQKKHMADLHEFDNSTSDSYKKESELKAVNQHANDRLVLREAQYQEIIDVFNELTPQTLLENKYAAEAKKRVKELASYRNEFVVKQKEKLEKMKREKQRIEEEAKAKIWKQKQDIEDELAREAQKDEDRANKFLRELEQRKLAIVKDKEDELASSMKDANLSQKEKDEIMAKHISEVNQLEQSLSGEKSRQQKQLADKIAKKREERRLAKLKEAELNVAREKESQLKNVDHMSETSINTKQKEAAIGISADESQVAETIVNSSRMEADWLQWLMSSPLNDRLVQIEQLIKNKEFLAARPCADIEASNIDEFSERSSGHAFLDIKDAQWVCSGQLQPVDLQQLSPLNFIAYRFGWFVFNLLQAHGQFDVRSPKGNFTFLIASNLPENTYARNAFRNSVYYDENRNILFLRQSRLENIGELTVVLIHTAAHIRSGNMEDDSHPSFLREFYQNLKICCQDLFFARSKNSYNTEKGVNYGVNHIEHAFRKVSNPAEKLDVVQDIIDLKVSPAQEKMASSLFQRLEENANFLRNERLREYLQQLETNIGSGDSNDYIERKLEDLTGIDEEIDPANKAAKRSQLLRDSSFSLSSALKKNKDVLETILGTQISDLEGKIDNLDNELIRSLKEQKNVKNLIEKEKKELNDMRDILAKCSSESEKTRMQKSISRLEASIDDHSVLVENLKSSRESTTKTMEKLKLELEQKRNDLRAHKKHT